MLSKILLAILNFVIIALLQTKIVEGIVTNNFAEPDQFKYSVSIQRNHIHICGGAIIHQHHVLTSANCFLDRTGQFINGRYSIMGGTNELYNDNAIIFLVEKIYVPKNGIAHLINPWDVAIVKLSSSIADYFQLNLLSYLSLPNPDLIRQAIMNRNTTIMISGYGVANNFPNDLNESIENICEHRCIGLRFAETILVQNRVCQLLYNEPIHDSAFCGRVNRNMPDIRGVCYGDIGSPLVIDNFIIGILTEHRLDCDEALMPARYSKILRYISLIQYVVRNANPSNERVRTAVYEGENLVELRA